MAEHAEQRGLLEQLGQANPSATKHFISENAPGVPGHVRALFAEATGEWSETECNDARLHGEKALNFLARLSLPHQQLRLLWCASKQASASGTYEASRMAERGNWNPGLDIEQFDALLRLAALAQNGRDIAAPDACVHSLVQRAREADLMPQLTGDHISDQPAANSNSSSCPVGICIRPPPHRLRSSVQLRCLAYFVNCLIAVPSLPFGVLRAWNVPHASSSAPAAPPKGEPDCLECLHSGSSTLFSTPSYLAPDCVYAIAPISLCNCCVLVHMDKA